MSRVESTDNGGCKRCLTVCVGGDDGVGKTTLIGKLTGRVDATDVDVQLTRQIRVREVASSTLLTDDLDVDDIYVLVVDAQQGFSSEARRWVAMARTAGARHVVLAVNKLDLAGWDRDLFEVAASAFANFVAKLEINSFLSFPSAAQSDDNITRPSAHTPWYAGVTLAKYLEELDVDADLRGRPLRLPIEVVTRKMPDGRFYSGVIASGSLRSGDVVQVADSGATSVVDRILVDDEPRDHVTAGDRVAISLASQIDVGSGAVLARPGARPRLTEQFAAHIAWMSDEPLFPGREYALTIAGQKQTATVTAIKHRFDPDTTHREPAHTLSRGEIGACTIATFIPLAVDDFSDFPCTGQFTLSDRYSNATLGAGTVDFALRRGMNIHPHALEVSKEERAELKEQRPCVIWFTGLSGAGKSTVANLVERQLVSRGRHTYLLDGDNVRRGLNKDLGFTAADRVENIRRVGEIAKLFVDAGIIVLCAFISPFRAERSAVRSLLGEENYVEIYVTAPLEVCERRDPKGLYAKSRAGQLPNFTGIDSPYEAPETPDLVLETTEGHAAEFAQRVVDLLQTRGTFSTSVKRMEPTTPLGRREHQPR